MIRDLNTIDEIIKRTHTQNAPPIAIKFHATWCTPCKEITPKFQTLAKKMPEIDFASVDVDEVEIAVETYSVGVIPAIHVWYRGARIDALIGRESFPKLEPLLIHLRDHKPQIENEETDYNPEPENLKARANTAPVSAPIIAIADAPTVSAPLALSKSEKRKRDA